MRKEEDQCWGWRREGRERGRGGAGRDGGEGEEKGEKLGERKGGKEDRMRVERLVSSGPLSWREGVLS